MTLHEHCDNCFILRCSSRYDCPIVPCIYSCGVEMHECKMPDHSNVCQNQRIPCINAYYGCPANVIRSRLSSHLAKCPANVILCTMEWGRYPLYFQERLKSVPFAQRNPPLVKGYLDVELAIRDQKVINRIRQQKNRQGMWRMSFECHDPNLKVSYERAKRIREEIKNTTEAINDLDVELEISHSKREKLETNETQEAVLDSVEMKEEKSCAIPECPQLLETHPGLGVNINLETIWKFQHSCMYRLPCDQLLHRREFSAHFKNVHNDIHGGLGWMEQRCPYAQYGCPHVRYRLRPSTQEGSVVFSQDLETFGVKPIRCINDTCQVSYLTWLPSELLEVICKWLDGFSLSNLALTCKTLHYNVFQLLPTRGVVHMSWKKRIYEDYSTSWMMDKKCWSFTMAFTEVHNWVHSETAFMSSHVEKCPFYQQHVAEKPFCYEFQH